MLKYTINLFLKSFCSSLNCFTLSKQIEETSTSITRKTKFSNIENYSNHEIAKLIYNFSNEKDLNNFISRVNEIAEKNNIELFNPEN